MGQPLPCLTLHVLMEALKNDALQTGRVAIAITVSSVLIGIFQTNTDYPDASFFISMIQEKTFRGINAMAQEFYWLDAFPSPKQQCKTTLVIRIYKYEKTPSNINSVNTLKLFLKLKNLNS